MNSTGMSVVCFSHSQFFCTCLCLRCLQPHFRALGIVWVISHSFGAGIVHHLFFWILLCDKCSEKILELFSTSSTGWGTGSAGSLGSIFRNNS